MPGRQEMAGHGGTAARHGAAPPATACQLCPPEIIPTRLFAEPSPWLLLLLPVPLLPPSSPSSQCLSAVSFIHNTLFMQKIKSLTWYLNPTFSSGGQRPSPRGYTGRRVLLSL